VSIFNATTGARNGDLNLAAATFKGMRLDDTGSYLTLFQNSGLDGIVTKYDTHDLCQSLGSPGTRAGGQCTTDGDGTIGSCNPVPVTTTTTTSGCSSPICVDGNVPEGFTAATYKFFLGLVFTSVIAVGGATAAFGQATPTRGFGIALGAFAAIGYLMALAFGLVPLWPIVATVVVVGGILILRLRGGGD